MRPVVPQCDVAVYGALDSEGETFRKCRLSVLGKPARAVLYSRFIGERRWKPVDHLSNAEVTEHPDGRLTIRGVSSELVNIVGLRPDEAWVRWEVQPTGCTNCN